MKPPLHFLKGKTKIMYVWEGGPIDIQVQNQGTKGVN